MNLLDRYFDNENSIDGHKQHMIDGERKGAPYCTEVRMAGAKGFCCNMSIQG